MTHFLLPDDEAIPDPALAEPLAGSPLPTVAAWLAEARASSLITNHDAIALATVDEAGWPQVRMVLARNLDFEPGSLSFYTNRESPKGRALDGTGQASAVFYWDPLSRQVRFRGRVERTSDADSDAYFATRHPGSQIAAWASAQSEPIASRAELIERFEAVAAKYRPEGSATGGATAASSADAASQPIPRPPHWGGYRLIANRIELWVGRNGRLHDRAVWTRDLDAGDGAESTWSAERLQP